ncbi:MAG: hypothetical protein ACPGJS_01420 [Flammeovirgaceae bacterium]
MKKDFLQLGLLPAIILGFLGFSVSLKLMSFISGMMGFRFSLMSVDGLDSFRFAVAILFASCPFIALGLFYRRFAGDISNQPITFHLRYLVYLLLGVVGGITLDIVQIKLFRLKIEDLAANGANWTSFIEQLKPFPYGLSVVLVIAAAIFFTQPRKSAQ